MVKGWFHLPVPQVLHPHASAGYVMKRKRRAPQPWNPPAHALGLLRECIQRWCNEKGNIICEICLQRFEPGYTVPEKKTLIDVGVTIRGSLEVPRVNYDPLNPEYTTSINGDSDYDEAECAPSSHRSATCCRSVVLVFTILLLIRHLIAVVSDGTVEYAFTILTLCMLRASGILLPLYLVTRFIKSIQRSQRQNQPQQHEEDNSSIVEAQGRGIELNAVEVRS